MNLDEAREQLSAANTAIGNAHRELQHARTLGSRFDVAHAEEKWEYAQHRLVLAERLVAELTIADDGGYRPPEET